MPKPAFADVKSILLPVDFNESNRRAGRQARVLAERFKAVVTLLHVREGSELLRSSSEGVHEALSATRNRLNAFRADELAGVHVKQLVLSGYPPTTIAEFADRQHCDLIVMPTHGYGPVRRFLLGSVTAKVLESARCPVWTIATSTWESNGSAVKQVLCGVELTPATANIIRWASLFAQAFGAALRVLSVLPPAPPQDVPDWFVPEWNEGALPGLESRLSGLVQELGVHADILVDKGDPATILPQIGQSFAAVVTGVTPKGVFVRISDPPAEGLLVRGQETVDVGDRIRVKLLSTDASRGYLDFVK